MSDKQYMIDCINKNIQRDIEESAELENLRTQNKRYKEALKDIAYCKTWTAQNRGMDLVGIAIAALKDKGEQQ